MPDSASKTKTDKAPAHAGNGAADAADAPALTLAVPHATVPRDVPPEAVLDEPALYFNRELSWLDFNWRVLFQAIDERTPLLERVRFLAITSSNLDEFFRKRVGGLKRQEAAGVRALSPDGRTPRQQLRLIRKAVEPMYATMHEVWETQLRPSLRDAIGLHVLHYPDLTKAQRRALHRVFQENIFPILTPLAVDPGHPFPFISNLSLSLAVSLRHPTRGTHHFARLKVPTSRGRWVRLGDELHVVPLEQVIIHNLNELFRGMEVVSAHAFRITRNADLSRDEEEAEDLILMISDELRERRFAHVVRLEVERAMPEHVRQLLLRELSLEAEDVYETDGLLDFTDCNAFADLAAPEYQYPPWEPVVPAELLRENENDEAHDIFGVIRQQDILVHHPFESFRGSVQRFVEEAAADPHVLAIKQTLYRTSAESPIVAALIRAAEAGKQVAVLVEVKARFDEANNIEWGQRLEKSGVHVTYGLVGLKTHSKVTLVIREEEGGLRTYCHIGTGNYNPKTARLYTDVGLLTCAPDLGYDVTNLFHYLTGYAPEQHYRKLIVAPKAMRKAFVEKIRREVQHQKKHGDGYLIAKMNGLDDVEMIQELYRASQAGVRIDLIVRGHTRLRPGLPGYSDNIRIISIIGRFLEHSRLFYFQNHDDPEVYLGSGDWMRRNLDDRVEAAVGVEEPGLRNRLIHLLHLCLEDQRQAWDLLPDGTCIQRTPASEEEAVGLHALLMQRARDRRLDAAAPWDI